MWPDCQPIGKINNGVFSPPQELYSKQSLRSTDQINKKII